MPSVARFPLPDVLALQHAAVRGGDLVLLGQTRQREDALVWVTPEGARTVLLDVPPDDGAHHYPSLLAHPGGGVVVLLDLDHARYVRDPDTPATPLEVRGSGLLSRVAPRPILHGGSAVSDEPRWHVVLSDGLLMGDLRHAAPLSVDLASGTARWDAAPWCLDPAEFPVDLNGIRTEEHVSLLSTLVRGGEVYATSPGSLTRRLTSSGSDFSSCVRLDREGRVADRLHELSGWMRQPGKRAIHGRFTSDGAYAILKPVFRSDEWGGRTRVLRLDDAELLVPSLPRGFARAEVLDHHPARGWWLRLDDAVAAVPGLVG